MILLLIQVVYSRRARQRLRSMPNNVERTIAHKIDALAADPLAPNNNVTPLRHATGFRLRVGDWRVLYSLDTKSNQLKVAAILPRGEAYR